MNDDNRERYGIVRNVFASSSGKLAAWISASHVEKALKKKETPTP